MKRRKKNILIVFFCVLALIVTLLMLYFSVVNNAIINSTRLNLESIAKKSINQSVGDITTNRALYNEMIDIKYKDTGEISLIQIKAYQANKVCNDIVEITENNINYLGKKGINIRVGLFTAIPILSGLGGDINLKFKQIGAVNCIYNSKFETAGINQNIHKLYVQISTKIGIVFPFHTEVVEVVQAILLCENVIVGEVPYTYLQSTELDSLLNLVPS